MTLVTDNIYIERKNVKWLTDQIKESLLTVDNSFQRQYVWTTKNQVRLIETILLGYAIPEIYLWERETDSATGNTKLSVIDGQQRLGSIFDFINGKFKLKGSSLDNKEADFANKYFDKLTESQRNQIWKYPLSVRFIKEEVKREDIVNMFLRLNSTNTTLNPQELRNAEFNGLFLRLANELSSLDFWEKIPLFTGHELRRMKDIEFISSLLIFLRLGIEEETSQKNINRIYDSFNEEYEEYEEDEQLFKSTLDTVSLFAEDETILKFISRRVHFYTLFTVSYYLNTTNTIITPEFFQKYKDFINSYSDPNSILVNPTPEETKYHSFVNEYYQLSQEGTQRKSNRMRRFEIIKEILQS